MPQHLVGGRPGATGATTGPVPQALNGAGRRTGCHRHRRAAKPPPDVTTDAGIRQGTGFITVFMTAGDRPEPMCPRLHRRRQTAFLCLNVRTRQL